MSRALKASPVSSRPAEQLLSRNMPHSLEAERSVLSALLLHSELIHQTAEIVLADDFYSPQHKRIYQVLYDLAQELKPIDLVTVQDELIKRGQLESIGGINALIALQEDLPAIASLQQHSHLIKEKAVLRELIASAAEIISRCYDQNGSEIDRVLDEAEKVIFQIGSKRTRTQFVQLNIWLKKTFQHLSTLKSSSRGLTGIPSRLKTLDEITSGFQNGDLIVLAARPSMGKTALALHFALSAAHEGQTVGFFSLEMAAEQLTLRLLTMEARLQHHHIRNATITSDEWLTLTHTAAELGKLKLFIDDTAMVSIGDLRVRARQLKREHNLGIIVIDYLQLLHSARSHENRHQEVSEISRSLKALAKELNVPVIALSQLSRAVDSRTDKRPMLSDLRESGAIEQDADLILFLYRDIVYNPDTENPDGAELIIGKQRNGPTGTVQLFYTREYMSFTEQAG